MYMQKKGLTLVATVGHEIYACLFQQYYFRGSFFLPVEAAVTDEGLKRFTCDHCSTLDMSLSVDVFGRRNPLAGGGGELPDERTDGRGGRGVSDTYPCPLLFVSLLTISLCANLSTPIQI